MKNIIFFLWILTGLCTGIPALNAAPEYAAEAAPTPWEYPERIKVDESEIAFSEEEYQNGKIDSIYLMCRLNEGWIVSINFFHFKAWFANKWAVQLILVRPDGTSENLAYDLDYRKIVSRSDRLYVSDGANTVQGTGKVYTVDFDLKDFACHLQFENILNPWAPAATLKTLQESKKAFVYRLVVQPWAGVSGWIKVDGTRMVVKGQGYADKTLTVDPMSKLNPFLHVMRVFDKEAVPDAERRHINFLTSVSLSEPGSVRIPYLIIARGNQWLLASDNYSLVPTNYVKHKKSGYEYPTRIGITCDSREYHLKGEYTVKQLACYVDILEDIPAWVRFFVLLFFKRPVKFYCTGVFEGTLVLPDGSTTTLSLEGPYTYVVLK